MPRSASGFGGEPGSRRAAHDDRRDLLRVFDVLERIGVQ
jgi:hypothetical protein